MKKTLCSALTTALVVGAASTTFAAANPFSDVPADHWAYDAVSELAADGIIEGYGDGTFRGQRQITRYEMAQMVAKAMAKSEQADAQTRALIDRLAAEFSDELNNLGVRVSALEEKVDNVKWGGELRYTYANLDRESEATSTTNRLELRLKPVATVNDHWKVRARIDGRYNMRDDKGADGDVKLKQAWAEGTYGSTVINAGLQPLYTEQGMIYDDNISALAVTFGKGKTVDATLIGGRLDLDRANDASVMKGRNTDVTADFFGGSIGWNPSSKFRLATEFYHIGEDDNLLSHSTPKNDDAQNIWGIASTYKFDRNWAIDAGYWTNTTADDDYDNGTFRADAQDHAYNVELRYKGAKAADRGSFGLWAAYRSIGDFVGIAPTYNGAITGAKGWEFGAKYTFDTNVVGQLVYFRGTDLKDIADKDIKKFFGRIQFFF